MFFIGLDSFRSGTIYKVDNQIYLDVELKTNTIIEKGYVSMLPLCLEMIEDYEKQYPKICTPDKMEILKGKLYYGFAKNQRKLLGPLIEKSQSISPTNESYDQVMKEIDELTNKIEDMKNQAEKNFLAAYAANPKDWKVLYNTFQFYMSERNHVEAKKYLKTLIEIFPESWDFFYNMGKLQEMESNFLSASQNYFEATRKALETGITNLDINDLMDIADRSLVMNQKMLEKMGIEDIQKGTIQKSSVTVHGFFK